MSQARASKGRSIIIFLLIMVLVGEGFTFSTGELRIQGIVRLILTVLLFVLVLLRMNWAKITIAVLLILGGVLGLLASVGFLSRASHYVVYILLIFSVAYLLGGIGLLTSQSVKLYISEKNKA
ncbi:MAG: hypothetical protein OEZ36_01005 [Spirochaetota bacterium]|nr:hypothetical protein [Spirochaetota bacterium]